MRGTRDRSTSYFTVIRLLMLALSCLGLSFSCRLNAQGCVFQSDTGRPYSVTRNFQPHTAALQGPALKVVALGDSVVWGDGDKRAHKIVTLVSQNLADDTGRPVVLDSYAHSGAKLQSAQGDPHGFPVQHGVPVSDVDASRPTTEEQATCAQVEDSNADYVLIDGCINEIGATNIAVPPTFGLNQTTKAQIRAGVLQYCAAPMREVLEKALREFPHAKIVLLNYFLVVSVNSEPKPMERAVRKEANRTGTPTEHKLTDVEVTNTIQAWRDNSVEFLADTTSCFEWAIASAIAGGHESPTSQPDPEPACKSYQPEPTPSPDAGRIVFAQVSSNPNFSYGAPDSHLWLLPIPLVFGFAIHPDELFRRRNCECERTHFLARKDLDCKVNPVAHPTPAGAQCYAKSIMNSLQMAWSPPAGESAANCSDE